MPKVKDKRKLKKSYGPSLEKARAKRWAHKWRLKPHSRSKDGISPDGNLTRASVCPAIAEELREVKRQAALKYQRELRLARGAGDESLTSIVKGKEKVALAPGGDFDVVASAFRQKHGVKCAKVGQAIEKTRRALKGQACWLKESKLLAAHIEERLEFWFLEFGGTIQTPEKS
jgi:hypothetical protein